MRANNSEIKILLTASGGIHALGVIDCLRNNYEKRKFKITTPGQVRDFEILVKNRRFQKYEEITPQEEDAPANATGPAIANWDPLLGGKKPKIFLKRKRKITNDIKNSLKK